MEPFPRAHCRQLLMIILLLAFRDFAQPCGRPDTSA